MALGKKHTVFILSIGDEGAILTLTKGGKVLHRSFSKKPIDSDFQKVLAKNPKVPVYILVDVLDQAYIRHTLPPVNSFNAQKLIQRKMQKDFNEKDLKKSLLVKRDKTGKKEWHFLLISTRFVSPLSDWVEMLSSVPNILAGIHLLPVEYSNLLRDIIKAESKEKGSRKRSDDEWQIVISHNRIGGFRQMVFHKNRIVFTRITQPVGGNDPEVIAGNIEQETLNTIEYIRRLGFKDHQILSVYFVVAEQVSQNLSANHFPDVNFASFTPHELAKIINLPDAAAPNDRFGDVLTAVHFACQKKPLMQLQTSEIQQAHIMLSSRRFLRILATLGAIILMFSSYQAFSRFQDYQKTFSSYESAKQRDQIVDERYKSFQEEFAGEAQKIISLANINQKLARHQFILFDFLKKYTTLNVPNVSVQSFSFDTTYPKDDASEIAFNSKLSMIFTAPNNISADQLLDEIDLFVSSIERHFQEYKVKFESLPIEQLMTLDLLDDGRQQQDKEIVITLQISAPKTKDKK